MQNTSTPPDMTKEQARELKELNARLSKLDRAVRRQIDQDTRRIDAIDRLIERHYAKLLRELGAKQKSFCATLRAEKRLLRTGIHRHVAGTSATQRECAAITKRIAVLEGRLAS